MNWDQTESKWALMTRRIRADFGDERTNTTEGYVRSRKSIDPRAPIIADNKAYVVKEAEFKTSAK